jgi:hypothetical protein
MTRRVLAALSLVLLTAGCASIQTQVEKSPDADFDLYQTWDWYPRRRTPTGDPRIDQNKDLQRFILSAIEENLAQRGYRRSVTSPDLYVDYHLTLEDITNSQVINNYYGESYYPDFELNLPGFQDTYSNEWEQGALLLMVFDAKSKELVWRGLAQTEVNTQGPRKEAREKLEKAVEKLAKGLPKT